MKDLHFHWGWGTGGLCSFSGLTQNTKHRQLQRHWEPCYSYSGPAVNKKVPSREQQPARLPCQRNCERQARVRQQQVRVSGSGFLQNVLQEQNLSQQRKIRGDTFEDQGDPLGLCYCTLGLCMCAYVCACMWRSKVNSGYYSLGTVPLFLSRLSQWTGIYQRGKTSWQMNPGFSSTSPNNKYVSPQPVFLTWALMIKLGSLTR